MTGQVKCRWAVRWSAIAQSQTVQCKPFHLSSGESGALISISTWPTSEMMQLTRKESTACKCSGQWSPLKHSELETTQYHFQVGHRLPASLRSERESQQMIKEVPGSFTTTTVSTAHLDDNCGKFLLQETLPDDHTPSCSSLYPSFTDYTGWLKMTLR